MKKLKLNGGQIFDILEARRLADNWKGSKLKFKDFKAVSNETVGSEDHYLEKEYIIRHIPSDTFWQIIDYFPASDGTSFYGDELHEFTQVTPQKTTKTEYK